MKQNEVYIYTTETKTSKQVALRVYVVQNNLPSFLGVVKFDPSKSLDESSEVMHFLAKQGNYISEKFATGYYSNEHTFIIKKVG